MCGAFCLRHGRWLVIMGGGRPTRRARKRLTGSGDPDGQMAAEQKLRRVEFLVGKLQDDSVETIIVLLVGLFILEIVQNGGDEDRDESPLEQVENLAKWVQEVLGEEWEALAAGEDGQQESVVAIVKGFCEKLDAAWYEILT